jgi:hypothetical protein
MTGSRLLSDQTIRPMAVDKALVVSAALEEEIQSLGAPKFDS